MQCDIASNLKKRDLPSSSLICSFNKLLLYIYSMPDPVQGSGNATMIKIVPVEDTHIVSKYHPIPPLLIAKEKTLEGRIWQIPP